MLKTQNLLVKLKRIQLEKIMMKKVSMKIDQEGMITANGKAKIINILGMVRDI